MCGIAGVIKIHDPSDGTPPPPLEAIPESWLDILDESIKHRGPDGQGRFRDRATRDDGTIVDVALVHRRLSIIDHEGGSQPMVHDGDRLRPDLTYQPGDTPIIASEVEPDKPVVAVVFNGCIYNHRELRTELEAAGHVFETDHSDTEVLVHGWRCSGFSCLNQLDAMFATAIWDATAGDLFSVRDRSGEKPLYTLGLHDLAGFSSTASGLTLLNMKSSATYPNSINKHDTATWIRFGWTATPSPFMHIRSVQSGCGANFSSGTPRWMTYDNKHWIQSIRTEAGRGTPLSIDDLDSMLTQSTRARLDCDVPLGVFLSGGIDSSLITAITHQHRPDIKTFTVRMPDKRYDESEAAQQTADELGTDHTTLDCEANPAGDLIMLIEQLGLPFGDSSLLPSYWVSKAASQNIKVALAGDGGDELFLGYRRYSAQRTLSRVRRFRLIGKLHCLFPQTCQYSLTSYINRFLRASINNGYSDLMSIFDTSDLAQLSPAHDPTKSHLGFCDNFGNPTDAAATDILQYLPGDLLRKTDTSSMSSALEVRTPFLDKELVLAANQCPIIQRMPNGQRKGLLKQVARKYLPDHIVDRPKQGFAIPIGEWFRTDYGDMRQLLYDHLESSNPFPGLADAGVNINMKFVNQMLREHDAAGEKSINPWHGRDHSQRLYMLLVLSIWSKWLDRVGKEAHEKTHG